jgi:GntR family transcriptional regulator, rspAB operon transcriptional repressor
MKNVLADRGLDRKQPLRDQVYSLLRQRIVTGAIQPGDNIDDKDIAAQFGVSRTPVREAIKKLSDEHLVEVVAQSGTRAARIDLHELEQAYLIRRALEMESAAQAATRFNKEHLNVLNNIFDSHSAAIDRKNYVEAISADDQFHRYIASISNLPRLWLTIEISKAQLDRCRHMMVPRDGEADATLKAHRQVIKALTSGDSESARTAMGNHLDAAMKTTRKVLHAEAGPSFSPFTREKPTPRAAKR